MGIRSCNSTQDVQPLLGALPHKPDKPEDNNDALSTVAHESDKPEDGHDALSTARKLHTHRNPKTAATRWSNVHNMQQPDTTMFGNSDCIHAELKHVYSLNLHTC